MGMPDPHEASTWGGKTIVDRAGATIGSCTQVYIDDATGLPEWATARMGNTSVLLPLVGAVEEQGQVRVTVGRDQVLLAPAVADRRHISEDEEERLYRHYGIATSQDGSPTLLPASERSQRPTGAASTSRAAERAPALLIAAVLAGALAGLVGALSVLSRRRHPTMSQPPTSRGRTSRGRTSREGKAVRPGTARTARARRPKGRR